MQSDATTPSPSPTKTPATIVQELETLIAQYKQNVQSSKETTSGKIKTVVKSYKQNLSKTLSTLNEVPYESANLTEPTEEFETLSENMKRVRHEGEQELTSLTHQLKVSVKRLCNTRDKPYYVNCVSNHGTYQFVLQYNVAGDLEKCFWCHKTNFNVYSDSSYGNYSGNFVQNRPNITISKQPQAHIPFAVYPNGNRLTPLGQNPAQDKLWQEMVDYYRP